MHKWEYMMIDVRQNSKSSVPDYRVVYENGIALAKRNFLGFEPDPSKCPELKDRLEHYGNEGWELISTSDQHYIFKRPKL